MKNSTLVVLFFIGDTIKRTRTCEGTAV